MYPVKLHYKVLLSAIIFILASLACTIWDPSPKPELSEFAQTIDPVDDLLILPTEPETPKEERPPTPTPIEIEEQPQVGGCYWHNYEISPPAESTSDPKMTIEPRINEKEIVTSLVHGVSGCPDQYFYTFHNWDFNTVLKPGQTETFWIRLEWENLGSADCTALVAGASTNLELDGNSYKAQNDSINVKIEPSGSLSNSTTWTVPEGNPGDTFTITVRAITGSYGGVVRFRYEYICD